MSSSPSFENIRPERRRPELGQHAPEGSKEVRLGFARSYTEEAKPGDTFNSLVARAYKNGKDYSATEARTCAARLRAAFDQNQDFAALNVKIKPGARLRIGNDYATFTYFDQQKGGFTDIGIDLINVSDAHEGQASENYHPLKVQTSEKRQDIFRKSTQARLDLIDQEANDGKGIERYVPGEEPPATLATVELAGDSPEVKNRLNTFQDFMQGKNPLRVLFDPGAQLATFPSQIQIPAAYKGYRFMSVRNDTTERTFHIGLNPTDGSLVALDEKGDKVGEDYNLDQGVDKLKKLIREAIAAVPKKSIAESLRARYQNEYQVMITERSDVTQGKLYFLMLRKEQEGETQPRTLSYKILEKDGQYKAIGNQGNEQQAFTDQTGWVNSIDQLADQIDA